MIKNMMDKTSFPPSVLWILGLSLFVRLILAAMMGAGFDEAYYYVYSLNPSLSYFDHPPMVGLLAGSFPYLTSWVSPFSIRVGAIILFTFSGILFYRLSGRFLSERASVIAYGLFNALPIFSIGAGVFVLPDAAMTFFWIATLTMLYKIIIEKQDHILTWIIAGLLCGFTLISKYHGIFLLVLPFLYLLLYDSKKLLSLKPILYGVSAALVFSPVILWNAKHNFISFISQGAMAIDGTFRLVSFFQALAIQLIYLSPFVFIPVAYIIWLTFRNGIIKRQISHRFYFFYGSVPVLFFYGISFFRPIFHHWMLAGYILLIIPLAQWLAKIFYVKRWVKRCVYMCLALEVLLIGVLLLHLHFGILHLEKWAEKSVLPSEVVKMDPTLDLYGWEKVSEYLTEKRLWSDDIFLFTHKWFLSGEVALATKGQYDVLCLNQNDPSGFTFWDKKKDLMGKDALFVQTNRYADDPQKWNAYFEKMEPPDSVVVSRGKGPAKTIYFIYCHHYKGNFEYKFKPE